MFVDTGLLHTGANDSHSAGVHADDGANHLRRTTAASGMFGDFAAAHTFHEAVSQAHTHHATKLRAHQETLSNIGDKARTTATAFTDMEEHNKSALEAVPCSYKT